MGTQPSNASNDAIVAPNYLTEHHFGVIQNAKNVLSVLQSALTQLTPHNTSTVKYLETPDKDI